MNTEQSPPLYGSPAAGRPKLLIVCQGNTCRSVMAEALARRRFEDTLSISSAGLHPQPASDAQMAIETLSSTFGIDASNHTPRALADLHLEDFDYVVAVDKRVAKQLPALPAERLIVWNIPDPWAKNDLQYPKAALRINQELSKFAAVLKKRQAKQTLELTAYSRCSLRKLGGRRLIFNVTLFQSGIRGAAENSLTIRR